MFSIFTLSRVLQLVIFLICLLYVLVDDSAAYPPGGGVFDDLYLWTPIWNADNIVIIAPGASVASGRQSDILYLEARLPLSRSRLFVIEYVPGEKYVGFSGQTLHSVYVHVCFSCCLIHVP